MKKILFAILGCVLVFCYPSWGCQQESQDFVVGLTEIVLDVVTAPCSLLAVCLGLDAGPCAYQRDQRMQCTPLKEGRNRPCVNPVTRRSVIPVTAPKASSVSRPESEKKPATVSEPLRPVQESRPGRPIPPVDEPVAETTKFPEPKMETSVPIVPEVAPFPSTASAPVVSPLRLQDIKTSEVEAVRKKVREAHCSQVSFHPTQAILFLSNQPNPTASKNPLPRKMLTQLSKQTLLDRRMKLLNPRPCPKLKKASKENRYGVQSLGQISVRQFTHRHVDRGFSIVDSVLSFITVKPVIKFLAEQVCAGIY